MKTKYDTIGKNYNHSRKADPCIRDALYRLMNPRPGGTYLDIGCGTGNYTIALHKLGVHIMGVDPSGKMIKKAAEIQPVLTWRIGRAEDTGMDAESMDGVFATLTIHHWSDLEMAFRELYRLIRTPGRIVIFTSTPAQMKGYWLNHYFPCMMADSIEQMPSLTRLTRAIESAGFTMGQMEKYFIQPDLCDLFLYSGKHNPALYLDPSIRDGISSFSSLSSREEVEEGLSTLASDMESGTVSDIIRDHKSEAGDYLFVVADKYSG